MTSYPTISISLTEERQERLTKLLRTLREQDESISRSEAVGRAIDHFFVVICLSGMSDTLPERHAA